MTLYYADDTVALYHGDCIEVMRSLPDASVDSVVTDPPYNLSFMAKPWDAHEGREDAGFAYWLSGLIDGEGCFTIKAHTRGTHAPSFRLKLRADEAGIIRRIHRSMGVGTITEHKAHEGSAPQISWDVQDKAGCQRLVDLLDKYPLRAKKAIDYWTWREAVFEWTSRPRGNRWAGRADNTHMSELRSRLMENRAYADVPWSGHEFQDWCRLWAAECLRVLKPGGHMLAFGGTRTWHRLVCAIEDAGFEVRDSIAWFYGEGFPKSLNLVDDTGARTGWGTALKPAHEPVCVARKPLAGTVAANVIVHGTGALNIDACRIDGGARPLIISKSEDSTGILGDGLNGSSHGGSTTAGRWPANVILDEHAAAILDEQSGELASGSHPTHREGIGYRSGAKGTDGERIATDSGGASRFFYIAREDNDLCPSTSTASTADSPSSQPSAPGDSAPSDAATSAHHDTNRQTDSPSTNATPSESRPSAVSSTPPTASTGSESLPASQPARLTPTPNRASDAVPSEPTDTMTTTTSRSTSGGSAEPATSSTTPSSVYGVPLDELGSRFKYVAKADASERPRVNGVAHPTVKPLDLMRWLVRLVTPPGGTVLEPFAGSGTTVEACIIEGFQCIAIEKGDEYLPLIESRITRRRDPVRHVDITGDDLGLFEFIGGEAS